MINAIREQLDPWLGAPSYKRNHGRFTLYYSFLTEFEPRVKRKLKIEINTREHFSVFGYHAIPVKFENRWYKADTKITTYTAEELIGTKLRALYQRKKGRDLFDLWVVLTQLKNISCQKIIQAFEAYMQFLGLTVSRAEYEKNLAFKKRDPIFMNDIYELLVEEIREIYDQKAAFELIEKELIELLPGNSWKGRQ